MPRFPRQIFSDTTEGTKLVPSNPRPTAAARASSERQQAGKLLKASIDSFFVLSRNRTSLKSLKSYFHETRRVPCKCREIVATIIKQVKCCKGKRPKNRKLCNHRHRQRRCRHRLVQFSFVSESSAGSVHIACHSAARVTSATTSKFLPTFMLSLLGSSCDQWSSWGTLARNDDTPQLLFTPQSHRWGPDYILDENQLQVSAKSLNPNLCCTKIW